MTDTFAPVFRLSSERTAAKSGGAAADRRRRSISRSAVTASGKTSGSQIPCRRRRAAVSGLTPAGKQNNRRKFPERRAWVVRFFRGFYHNTVTCSRLGIGENNKDIKQDIRREGNVSMSGNKFNGELFKFRKVTDLKDLLTISIRRNTPTVDAISGERPGAGGFRPDLLRQGGKGSPGAGHRSWKWV